nr:ribonuclease H-like domain, reverse transcriptase, RNA-dependent DNA polymerase [Tanacetum cinerariifolium]
MSTIRCMMKATNMLQIFWAEAVRHAIYILNSVPTKVLEDIIPYEAIKRRKPNLENLRVFGCIAYAKVPSQHLIKLDDRSTKMVYLGNEQGSKAFRLFDPTTQTDDSSVSHHPGGRNVYIRREKRGKVCISVHMSMMIASHTMSFWDLQKRDKCSLINQDLPKVDLQSTTVFKTKKDANGNIIKHKARLVAKCYIQEHGIDFEEVFAPIARMETIRLLLAIAANYKWEVHHLDVKSAFLHGDLSYYLGIEVTHTDGDISIRQSAYANKILKEAGMIDCNETLIPMDPGTKLTKVTEGTMVNSTEYRSLIGCLRCLLHTRPDLSYSVGLLSRFMQEPREQHMKAIRQVLRYVKGTNDYGITYKHNGGNKIHGFSDSSYGVDTQEGKGTTGMIFNYGESPISWRTQKQVTVALSSCESEFIAATATATQALWLKRLLNDLIITGTPKKEIDKFKAQMEEKFKRSDLGLLAYYLGIEVTQTDGDISIRKSAYANKILKEAGMIDCNETLIPIDLGTKLTKVTEGTMVNSTEY